jgi:hypothetical protein
MATGDEDPKLQLLQTIREDLKRQEDLKREILAGLKAPPKRSNLFEIAKHPLLLLLVGSFIGAWITSRYQSGEWYRQQHVLEQHQQIEQKVLVRDQIVDSLIQAHSAAQSAVRPLFYENAASFKANELERIKAWDKENQAWQTAESNIQQKLALYFKDATAQSKFKEIVECRNEQNEFNNTIFVEVNNVINIVRKKPTILNENDQTDFKKQSEEFRKLKTRVRENILQPIETVRFKTKELLEIMQAEIEHDVSSEQPPSFWSHFFG